MKLQEIQPIAEKYKKILAPYCKRIEIAGSVRRKKPECRDIELVIIRDPEKIEELKKLAGTWERVRGSITGRYMQVSVPTGVYSLSALPLYIKIDIFIAVDDGTNWGNIYLIRTGNWKFSRFMMGIRSPQVGLKHRGGYLWRDDLRYSCYTEEGVFKLLDMDYIEPENRSWE